MCLVCSCSHQFLFPSFPVGLGSCVANISTCGYDLVAFCHLNRAQIWIWDVMAFRVSCRYDFAENFLACGWIISLFIFFLMKLHSDVWSPTVSFLNLKASFNKPTKKKKSQYFVKYGQKCCVFSCFHLLLVQVSHLAVRGASYYFLFI